MWITEKFDGLFEMEWFFFLNEQSNVNSTSARRANLLFVLFGFRGENVNERKAFLLRAGQLLLLLGDCSHLRESDNQFYLSALLSLSRPFVIPLNVVT